MTPVIKGFPTDKGFKMAINAWQVCGRNGHIKAWSMLQLLTWIAMFCEGANDIRVPDFVSWKLAQNDSKHVMAFFQLVKSFVKENEGN